MKNTISTVYGDYVQACLFLKQPFELIPNTTLNEKKGVQAGVTPAAGVIPTVGYVSIGNRGHRNMTGSDGYPYHTGEQHQPTDASNYNMLPFALRPLTNDLSLAERQNYRLRKIEEYNGVTYAAYYLRVLDLTDARPQMVKRRKVDGVVSVDPFVPSSSNLNPTPMALGTGEVLSASGESVGVISVIDFTLSAAEIEEIIEACRIMYDSEARAIVSEISVVSGVDQVVTGQAAGNAVIEYTEVICAQVCGILTTHHSLPNTNTLIKELLTLGTSNPLLAVQSG